MKHLGDISKVHGSAIAPVDIITFGSPCQDLSVAGKQAGMKHEDHGDDETTRSGLFMEAVRIIKEMRSATNGQQPRFVVWENVPGAFSSNKGADFQTVLYELCKITENKAPVIAIPKAGWPPAGQLTDVGGGSLAWRTIDAQFHGVPQRRRRIILVCDFTGQAGQGRPCVLTAFAQNQREEVRNLGDCAGTISAQPGTHQQTFILQGSMIGREDKNGPQGDGINEGVCFTLNTTDRHAIAYDCRNHSANKNVNPTLQAKPGGGHSLNFINPVLVIENHANDSRVNIREDNTVQTLTGRMGTGGGNVPLVMQEA
jgi:DNA (cytosine-5)-methyltransferase 1